MIVGATLLMVKNATGPRDGGLVGEDQLIHRRAGLPAVLLGPASASHPSRPIWATVSRYTLPLPISPDVEFSASRRSG
ncbi:hypothetical protein I552_2790 [Mycobacterium xenopi 3993]|nr:hypothetical protein I552_2790 [Mycobacterium xenopi 3993]